MKGLPGRIIIGGDNHLTNTQILSRKDDVVTRTLEKLDFIFKYAQDNKIPEIYLLGDFFHKQVDVKYLNQVIDRLVWMKNVGISVYSLIGNHVGNCVGKNYQMYGDTSFGTLVKTGLLGIRRNNVAFVHAYSYKQDNSFETWEDEKNAELVLAHYFINSGPPGEELIIPWDMLKSSYRNMKVLCLGHDHEAYDETVTDGVLCLAPGGMFRTSLNEKNRKVQFAILDTESLAVSYVDIPHESGDVVFMDAARSVEKDADKQLAEFMKSISEIDNSANDITLYVRQYLDGFADKDIKQRMMDRLIQEGLL